MSEDLNKRNQIPLLYKSSSTSHTIFLSERNGRSSHSWKYEEKQLYINHLIISLSRSLLLEKNPALRQNPLILNLMPPHHEEKPFPPSQPINLRCRRKQQSSINELTQSNLLPFLPNVPRSYLISPPPHFFFS